MLSPLLVHLIYHPSSAGARALAAKVAAALQDDPAILGLAIPTVIAPEDGRGSPPAKYHIDEAQHSAVVLLADDEYVLAEQEQPTARYHPAAVPTVEPRTPVAEQDEPTARYHSWPEFAAYLCNECERPEHRFIPIQLSEAAWGFHPAFAEVAFARAWEQPPEVRDDWTVRRIVIELIRFLSKLEGGTKAPITLFLSHAKTDIGHDPCVFEAVVKHLEVTEPVKTWIDSAEIAPGSRFAEEIAKGVENAAVLALVTESYSARPWCGKEVLLAKMKGRPLVVVDAYDLDRRAFPYLGNVPVVRWNDERGAAQAVDLLLKETLRHLHTRLVLQQIAAPTDTVFASPPELVTVAGLDAGATVLYPDPPLADAQRLLVASLGVTLETPFQRLHADAPLKGKKVALSLSAAGDSPRWGMAPEQLSAGALQLAQALLVAGATLVYGGHLGEAGYTRALFDMRDKYVASAPQQPVERIQNYLGWPLSLPTMPGSLRARYARHLRIIPVGRPAGVEDLEPDTFGPEPAWFAADSPARRFAWARGMTLMRETQTADTEARVLIGGRVGASTNAQPRQPPAPDWYRGRIPGVLEEALLSLRAAGEHRLYIVGAFGGVAAALARLLEGHDCPQLCWEYQRRAPHAPDMRKLYRQRGVPFEGYRDMKQWLREFGVAGLSRRNKLSEEDNRTLFWTRDMRVAVRLVLLGLCC